MGMIRPLDPQIIGQIAAGEVVERPAFAIKEMVENSIDAGATSITIEIRDGGLTWFRVSDNGRGILPEDIRMAFARHATSKLRTAEELTQIQTLGFRGEALASIAAVARVEMKTRAAGQSTGVHAVISAGQFESIREAASPEGTSITVKDLFYNVPARRKFLKKPSTEGAMISDLVMRLILSRPDISFRLMSAERVIYRSVGNGNLRDALFAVAGNQSLASLTEVSGSAVGAAIHGFVGTGEAARSTRTMQTFILNGRYIRSSALSQALDDACRERVMIGKFPICALHLTMPFDAVDVNVHPNKLEVRFQDERLLMTGISQLIRQSFIVQPLQAAPKMEIRETELPEVQNVQDNQDSLKRRQVDWGFAEKPTVRLMESSVAPPMIKKPVTSVLNDSWTAPAPQNTKAPEKEKQIVRESSACDQVKMKEPGAVSKPERLETAQRENIAAEKAEVKQPIGSNAPEKAQTPKTQIPLSASAAAIQKPCETAANAEKKPPEKVPEPVQQEEQLRMDHTEKEENEHLPQPLTILGTAWKEYILAQSGEKLYLIDQHAAHERILYEKLKSTLDQEKLSQKLLTPQIFDLSHREYNAIFDNLQLLTNAGFEIEDFGGHSIQVRAVPMVLGVSQLPDFFGDLAESVLEFKDLPTEEKRRDSLMKLACRKAVKAGDTLSIQEIESLISQMLKTGAPPTCPHGRPLVVVLEKREVDKRFRRIV